MSDSQMHPISLDQVKGQLSLTEELMGGVERLDLQGAALACVSRIFVLLAVPGEVEWDLVDSITLELALIRGQMRQLR